MRRFTAWQNEVDPIASEQANMSKAATAFRVRRAGEADLADVIALDERVTGVRKTDYWQDLYTSYQTRRAGERFFFVAEETDDLGGKHVRGFVIGEVRAWEFGSTPCGWVFAISVDPEARLAGAGEQLLTSISDAFRDVGVKTMRTMISRDNHLLMSFFRSEGMMAGPYVQLEKDLL
jgi:ribosomal protein S18 acetylase RimI-like enzyme